MTTEILNQGKDGECGFYATLGLIMRLNPNIDYIKIIEEGKKDFNKLLTIQSNLLWFKNKGYIKSYSKCNYNPITITKEPVVARLYNIDWNKTKLPPYKLITNPPGVRSTFAHYVCITDKNTFVNSWGKEVGDKGYFYFNDSQIKLFSQCYKVTI